jgi:ATP synthase protein I
MTTAPPTANAPQRRALGGRGTGPAAVAVLVGALLGSAVAALVAGAPAAAGVAVGAGLVLVFFGVGAVVVGVVASISPAASLLVALLTYGLQVLLALLALVALDRSGVLRGDVDPGWLGGTVIVATLTWSAAQIRAHVRSREPLYDVPLPGPEASAR